MSDWIHCNSCHMQPLKNCKKIFSLTSCGHLFCSGCLVKSNNGSACSVCKKNCSVIALTNQMSPDIDMYFKEPAEQMKKIIKVADFQKNHREKFTRWLLKEQSQNSAENSSKLVEKIKELQKDIMVLQHENSYMKKVLAGGIRASIKSSPELSKASPKCNNSGEKVNPGRFDPQSGTSLHKLGLQQNRPGASQKSPNTRLSPFTNERISVRTPPINGQIGIIKYADKPPTPLLTPLIRSNYERRSPSSDKYEAYPGKLTPGYHKPSYTSFMRQDQRNYSDNDVPRARRSLYSLVRS